MLNVKIQNIKIDKSKNAHSNLSPTATSRFFIMIFTISPRITTNFAIKTAVIESFYAFHSFSQNTQSE